MPTFDFQPGTVGSCMGVTAAIRIQKAPRNGFKVDTAWFDMDGYVAAKNVSSRTVGIVSDKYYPACCTVSLQSDAVFKNDAWDDPLDPGLIKCSARWLARDAGRISTYFDDDDDPIFEWWSLPPDGTTIRGKKKRRITGTWTQIPESQYMVWDENFKEFQPNAAVSFSDVIGDVATDAIYDTDQKQQQFGVLAVMVLTPRKNMNLIRAVATANQDYSYGALRIDSRGSLTVSNGQVEKAKLVYSNRFFGVPTLIGMRWDNENNEVTTMFKALRNKRQWVTSNQWTTVPQLKWQFFDSAAGNRTELLDVATWEEGLTQSEWDSAINAYSRVYGV